MTPAGDGWWRWDRRRRGIRRGGIVVDYAFVLDGAEPALPDPRSAWQPHGRARPEPHVRRRRSFAWTDDGWRGPRSGAGVLGAVVYELHVGTFTPEGTLDAAVTRLDHLVDARRRRRRADAGGGLPGPLGLGLRRRRPLGRARRLRRPGRPPAVRRRLPRAGPRRRASTSCTTTSAPAATTSRGSAPTSPRRTTPRGARRSTSTTPGRPRCDGSSSRARCAGSATSTSTHCASTPCTSSRTTRSRTTSPSCPTPWPPWRPMLGRPLDLVAESDLNDTVDGHARPRRAVGG